MSPGRKRTGKGLPKQASPAPGKPFLLSEMFMKNISLCRARTFGYFH
jgi:hypothetical protein